MTIKFSDAQNYLTDYCKEFLQMHTIERTQMRFDCPFCQSGTGAKGTPAFTITKQHPKYYKCYSIDCGAYGDIFQLIQYQQPNIASFKDALLWFEQHYNVHIDKRTIGTRTNAHADLPKSHCTETKTLPNPKKQIDKFWLKQFNDWHDALKNNATLCKQIQNRGLNDKIIERANIGYDDIEKCFILPFPNSDYFVRYFPRSNGNKYLSMKDIQKEFYNVGALYNDKPTFIVEGIFDALSIMQCGFSAMAICGCDTQQLADLILTIQPTKPILLLLDYDINEQGQKAQCQLYDLLYKKIMVVVSCNCIEYLNKETGNQYKDANDCLQHDPKRFTGLLKYNVSFAEREQQKVARALYRKKQK